MDINKFLNLCSGSWFSQRTNYSSGSEKALSSKADLGIKLIAAEDSKVAQLCMEMRIDPHQSIGALLYSWDTSVDWGKPKTQGSSLMVFIPDSESSTTGKLITNNPISPGTKSIGTYSLGEDEALTIAIANNDLQAEERIWFASENLRLRSATIKHSETIAQTTFYSEIRKAVPKQES